MRRVIALFLVSAVAVQAAYGHTFSALSLATDTLKITGAVRAKGDTVRTALADTARQADIILPHKDTVPAEPALEYSDIYLDTVKLKRKFSINDYSMIGVQYGVSLSQMMFNPSKKQGMQFNPINVGVVFTKYGKMFGYMPYFGFQTGFFYGKEGYQFKIDKETGDYSENVDGATSATYEYAEIPLLAHLHMDVWHLKFIINAGLFGAYRLSVEREGNIADNFKTSFYDYDKRFEYGIKAGIGFGFFFDPVEIHFEGTYRYSLGSLYKPDYNSEYYYRFAYPSDIIISAGVHIQLTRRTGKTKSQLRKEAKQLIYETGIENIDSEGR